MLLKDFLSQADLAGSLLAKPIQNESDVAQGILLMQQRLTQLIASYPSDIILERTIELFLLAVNLLEYFAKKRGITSEELVSQILTKSKTNEHSDGGVEVFLAFISETDEDRRRYSYEYLPDYPSVQKYLEEHPELKQSIKYDEVNNSLWNEKMDFLSKSNYVKDTDGKSMLILGGFHPENAEKDLGVYDLVYVTAIDAVLLEKIKDKTIKTKLPVIASTPDFEIFMTVEELLSKAKEFYALRKDGELIGIILFYYERTPEFQEAYENYKANTVLTD